MGGHWLREQESHQGAERPGGMARGCGHGVPPKNDKAGKRGAHGPVLRTELCAPKFICQSLNPRTSECDCIWRWSLYRGNQVQ